MNQVIQLTGWEGIGNARTRFDEGIGYQVKCRPSQSTKE